MILTAVAALAVYAVIVAALLVGNYRWHRAQAHPEAVNRLPYLPPVPAPTQAGIDATWLDAWPTDRPSDAEVRGQFDGRRTT